MHLWLEIIFVKKNNLFAIYCKFTYFSETQIFITKIYYNESFYKFTPHTPHPTPHTPNG